MNDNAYRDSADRDNADKDNPGDLAGAYALNALEAEDAARFEAHLAESEQARVEAEELSDTAVALGLAVAAVQPPAALKSTLMGMLASTPQLPPLPAADAASTRTAARIPEPAAGTEIAAEPATRSSATARAQTRWFHGPARVLLAAAAAIVLFIGGAVVGHSFNTNQFAQQQAASLAQINAAADSQRASATTTDGHGATLVWSESLGLSALLVDDLPALPGGKAYQLWYMNGAGAAAAGTFDSNGSGTVWRVLEGTMHAGDQVGVTVEPSGGSPAPTTAPIVTFQS